MRKSSRLLTLGPADEPLWVRLYVHQVEERWAAKIGRDARLPAGADEVKGTGFFEATAEEAERLGKAYLGGAEPAN